MIQATVFGGKRVALFGLGGSGLVSARALIAGGAELIAFDDNPAHVEKAEAEQIPTADLRNADWPGLAALVLAPGVPFTHPHPHWSVELAHRHGVPVIGDIEIFFRQMAAASRQATVIAITGTNGKSTTTALVAHILNHAGRNVQMGGNIGRAVLDLDPPDDDAANTVYVIECSSYQIDTTPSIRPHVGLLLNLTPDHLERHGSMENYAAIKKRLVATSDLAIVGVDDAHCRQIADELQQAGVPVQRISAYGHTGADISYRNGKLSSEEERVVADLEQIGSLRGAHNGQNAAAAFAACRAAGLSRDAIQAGLASFPGLAHRMEQIGTVGEVVFINDSKATNAEAAAPALSSFEKVFWIAGGLAKDGGIEALAPHFSRVAKAYFIGEAAGTFAAQLDDTIPYEISGTLQQAVNHAAADAQRAGGDQAVLLSPAAASFDQFPNFEKRGDAFREAVVTLDGFEPIEA